MRVISGESTLLKGAVAALAGLAAARDRRLSVLIFHRVTPEPDPLFPGEMHAARFGELMAMLAANFNVLPLGEAIDRLDSNALPRRAVSITFDDGYADNYTVACPLLKRHGLPATFFVASGFLDGGRMWNDTVIEAVRTFPGASFDTGSLGLGVLPVGTAETRRQAIERILRKLKYLPLAEREARLAALEGGGGRLPRDVMLTSAQVRALRDEGMEIGGHTVHHPILAVLPDSAARREIGEDRERLAGILGDPPRLFAYPNGKPGEDYAIAHVQMARTIGYRAALSTAWGSAGAESDRFQLPRFTPWDRSVARFGLRLAHNFGRRAATRVQAT